MKRNRLILGLLALVAVVALALSACVSTSKSAAEGPIELVFIETSDIHGAIYPYNFITGKPMDSSLAQVMTFVKQKRAEGSEVILLDNGDSMQGQPTVYYYNFEKTNVPHIWSEALNYMQYDVVTVGNHDIEAGHAVYDKLVKEFKIPYLCANVVDEKTRQPYFKPYTVIVRKGIKIAVLGLTEPGVTTQLPYQLWAGLDIEDMVDTAKKWTPIIQEKEKPDLIVGLFHAGVDYTYNGAKADDKLNESASQLVAERVAGFDLIFVGHDHSGWDGYGWDPVAKKKVPVKGPDGRVVPIYGPTAGAANVARVIVTMEKDKATKQWNKTINGVLVPMKDYKPDADFLAKFDAAKKELMAWVDRPVGKMEGKVTSEDALFGDSAFVDLIHRIQLEICADPSTGMKPAQISIAAPLDQYAFLPSSADGTIFVRDMFNLYKYENFLYTMDLTGKQVKDFMEYNYAQWMNQMKNAEDQLINFMVDKDGKFVFNARYNSYDTVTRAYNYDSFAGINYTVDVSKPAGERVTIISMSNGDKFDLAKTYSVAINSYRGSGGGNHLIKGSGIDPLVLKKMSLVTSATTKDLRYYMLKWFEKQAGAIKLAKDNNWKVIPEDWAAKGREKSYPMLYPPQK